MNREELLKNVKPILFNTEMVQAILESRKTVTRRKIDRDITNSCDVDVDGTLLSYHTCDGEMIDPIYLCRYQAGDILYVRETWQIVNDAGERRIVYKANKDINIYGNWRPSIHMPKEAARIFLKITDVRFEKLQNMTQEDCIKEGCGELSEEQFAEFWNKTFPKYQLCRYGWEANPWVWVIEFERCEKPDEN